MCVDCLTQIDDNGVDIVKSGKHNNVKLTPEQVLAIYAQKGAISGPQLAKQYGVSNAAIYQIWKHERWAFLTQPKA